MINKKVTGIGCFAKPATLSRVFKKMVQNYTLGQFESFNMVNGHDEVRGCLLYTSDAADELRSV